jgi:hypothetical protein
MRLSPAASETLPLHGRRKPLEVFLHVIAKRYFACAGGPVLGSLVGLLFQSFDRGAR